MQGRIKSVACAWLLSLASAVLAGTNPAIEITHSLAIDARTAAQQSKPLLLFITQPGCPYCERARREVLRHLAVDPAYTSRALFRELSTGTTVTGFDGKPQPGLDAARALGVRLYPTVLIVDAAGAPLAAPLRGYSPDFYTATLDGRLSDAARALKARK